ncbi:uncharacterized protein V1510DRAFT_420852 [Dipodascopsis tothii]|uniref:uncharacterized protein n=1 Tax=Dipodascopsis tothii TaxID=44089 RepID=UPI0034CFB249
MTSEEDSPGLAVSPEELENRGGSRKRKETLALPLPPGVLPPRKRAKTAIEKEQRRVERILRNRQAAQSSREKKRKQLEELEEINQQLVDESQTAAVRLQQVEAENSSLRKTVDGLVEEIERMKAVMAQFKFDPTRLNAAPATPSAGTRTPLSLSTTPLDAADSADGFASDSDSSLPEFKTEHFDSLDLPLYSPTTGPPESPLVMNVSVPPLDGTPVLAPDCLGPLSPGKDAEPNASFKKMHHPAAMVSPCDPQRPLKDPKRSIVGPLTDETDPSPTGSTAPISRFTPGVMAVLITMHLCLALVVSSTTFSYLKRQRLTKLLMSMVSCLRTESMKYVLTSSLWTVLMTSPCDCSPASLQRLELLIRLTLNSRGMRLLAHFRPAGSPHHSPSWCLSQRRVLMEQRARLLRAWQILVSCSDGTRQMARREAATGRDLSRTRSRLSVRAAVVRAEIRRATLDTAEVVAEPDRAKLDHLAALIAGANRAVDVNQRRLRSFTMNPQVDL